MTVKEAIDIINNNECWSVWDADDLIDEEAIMVADNLDINKSRWFTVSTNVYKLEDGYVGITGPSDLKSEIMCWSDCNYICIAEEYEPVQTITYKPKV